jgi:hypothetical protein
MFSHGTSARIFTSSAYYRVSTQNVVHRNTVGFIHALRWTVKRP